MKAKCIVLISGFCVLFLFSCQGQKAGKGQDVKMKTSGDSAGYAIGTMIGQNLKKDGLDSINVDLITAGIRAVLRNDSIMINQQACQNIVQNYVGAIKSKQGDEAKKKGQKFLEENKKKPGIITTATGLQYEVIKMGTGPKPTKADTVACNYSGKLIGATEEFDGSDKQGKPVSFPVGAVIPGWTEALQLMPVGSKWKLYIPSELAYGEHGPPGIGSNSVLIFDIELVSIAGK